MNLKQDKITLTSFFCHNLTKFTYLWRFFFMYVKKLNWKIMAAEKNSLLQSLTEYTVYRVDFKTYLVVVFNLQLIGKRKLAYILF